MNERKENNSAEIKFPKMVATSTPSATALTSAGTFKRQKRIFLFPGGILALLDETEPALKAHALVQLDAVVDQFWAEISDALPKMYFSLDY